jgi:phenylalanyl-tRNA synthetase alpha chain
MNQAEIASWITDADKAFTAALDLDQLKIARLAHTGDKAPISLASRSLGSLSPEEKASTGKLIGDAKAEIAKSLARATEKLEAERDAKVLLEEIVDITLPVQRTHRGGLHPISIIKNEISDFFIEQGFAVEEGPELESGWLNFDALNIPADHPARTMQDTFFIEPIESGVVLRTHTSPVQIRTMLTQEPPIYVICPGRTFRADELDATHSPVFHQVEGLVIDKGITMAHLKGTLAIEGDPYELAAANLVRTADAPVLSHRLAEPMDIGRLLVNLRAEADPADLEQALLAAVAVCVAGLPHEILHLEHFRPGRPVPTHRIPSRL